MPPAKRTNATESGQTEPGPTGVAPLASLRARLSLIIIIALVPATIFLIYDVITIRQRIHSEAQTELLRLSQMVAAAYGQRLDEAERLLAAIALFPEVRYGDSADCSARLAQMVDLYQPQYQGFAVADLDGAMFCTSQPISPTVQIADRLWFREAVRTGHFAVGEFTIGRPSGIPVIGLGYPVLDDEGRVIRVVAHGMALHDLQTQVSDLPVPEDAVLTITDRNGIILARVPDGEAWTGKRQTDAELQHMASYGSGEIEAMGVDGVVRMYAFTPIRGPRGAEVWLSIGRTPESIYTGVGPAILRDVVGISAILLAALAAVWVGSNRLLLRKIDRLVDVSARLGAGDWDVRAPTYTSRNELDHLGVTFNRMADALQQRQNELVEREQHLYLALQAARMVAWTWDPDQNRVRTTDNFPEIYGMDAVEYAEQGFALIHPADRSRHEAIVAQALEERAPYHSEFRILRADNGQTVWLEERAVPIVDGEGHVYKLAGVVVDVTERKLAEDALRQARELAEQAATRTSQLLAFTSELAFVLTHRQVVDVILRNRAVAFGAAALSIKLLSSDGQWLESTGLSDFPEPITVAYRRYPITTVAPMSDAVRTGEPVWIASEQAYLERYPHLRKDILALGLEAAAAIPLTLGERILGCLGLSFATPMHFDTEARQFLLTLASQCAQALERARLYTAEQQARVELEARVSERTAELERSNRELNQFAYVASHDLKAPLRAIDQLASWISADTGHLLPATSVEHLVKMRGRVKRMEKLLDDLLAYSRAGRLHPPAEAIDLELLVQDIVGVLAPPPGFEIVVEPPAPLLCTPRVSIELVLRNLIGNAIKHHHRPNGQICVRAVEQGEFVEFTVRDDGPGIEPQYHVRIFEMFQTLQPRDQVEGSGMGLAIVKKLVESYGGAIAIESAPGHGTLFRFTWPRRYNELSDRVETNVPASASR